MASKFQGNKSFLNSTEKIDFFEEVYANGPFTPLSISVFTAGVVLGTLGPLCIIWYERNCANRYRTIINQLFARLAVYILFYALLINIPEGIRFWHGPYNETYCEFLFILRNILMGSVLLTLDCILVFRYLFIFTVRNFAVICDDILAKIINMSILLIGFWSAFVKRMAPGHFPIVYHLCTGQDPNKSDDVYDFSNAKYNTGRMIVALSFLLHLLMVPRILYYQLVTMRNQRPLQLGTIKTVHETIESGRTRRQQDGYKSNNSHQNNNKTIIDVATQFLFLVLLVVHGIIILISEHIEPKKTNVEEYQYIPYTIQIYGPFFCYIMVYTIMLTRNEAMRKTLWKKLKTSICKNKVGIAE